MYLSKAYNHQPIKKDYWVKLKQNNVIDKSKWASSIIIIIFLIEEILEQKLYANFVIWIDDLLDEIE